MYWVFKLGFQSLITLFENLMLLIGVAVRDHICRTLLLFGIGFVVVVCTKLCNFRLAVMVFSIINCY